MILHKIGDGLNWLDDAIHPHVKAFIGLFLMWCATFALWFFPVSRIVIDAGPKGDSNGMANAMEVFGTIVGLITIVLSIIWLYGLEEFFDDRKKRRADDLVLAKVDARRELRDKEEILGMDVFPLDDDLDQYVNKLHPIEQRRKDRMMGYHMPWYNETPRDPRVRSKNYDKMLSELTEDGNV